MNWKLDGGNINDNTNKFKFRIELKKEKDDNFSQVYEGNDDNYVIKGLSQNTIYELRLSSNYDDFIIPLGQIQKVRTENFFPNPKKQGFNHLFG